MPAKHGLGRGLDALIKDGTPVAPPPKAPENQVVKVPVTSVRKSPWQPRHSFADEPMAELAQSVKERGVLQPLLVRAVGNEYELIAGERRWRAAAEAGLRDVPVIVMQADDAAALELALVENLQRQDLNVIEEAEGYQLLAERFNLTQEQIAGRVGKARASVANAMRLLALPQDVKQLVVSQAITPGHAKVLSGLEIGQEQLLYARRIVTESLSVRQIEKIIERARKAPRKPRAARSDLPANHLTFLSEKLHAHFGTSIRISPCKTYANGAKGRGSIEIDFYSNEDLDRILALLGISGD
jgi:ParB family chromosome partitioning protein